MLGIKTSHSIETCTEEIKSPKRPSPIILFLNFFKNFIYLFIHFWLRWVSAPARGPPPPAAESGDRPPTAAAPPAAEHRPQTRRLSSRGPQAQLHRGMRDPPRPGPEPASPAPAGRLPTAVPSGKGSPPISLNTLMISTNLPDMCTNRDTHKHTQFYTRESYDHASS